MAFRQKIALVIFGISLFVVMLEVILRLGGALYLFYQDYRNQASLKQAGLNQYRVLCLGESTTAFGGEDSYPSQLEEILNQKIPSRKFSVINRGIPGADTFVILSELEYNINKYNPDMIITMIGVNDDSISLPGNNLVSRIEGFIRPLRVYKLLKLSAARLWSKDSFKDAYFIEGLSNLEYRHYPEAERMFKKVIELAPRKPLAYVSLSQCYYEQGLYDKAWELIGKAEALASAYPEVYIDLGWRYFEMGFSLRAEEAFRKVIAANPSKANGYYDLAQFYQSVGKYPEAEMMFKKAMRLDPEDNFNSYMDLGLHYFERNMFIEAEDMLKKAIALSPREPMPYWYLGFVKDAQGKHAESLAYFDRIKFKLDFINKVTRRNYNKLRSIVLGKGIQLVCVQYPARKVETIERMFADPEGIVLVDNEGIFKEALKNGRYQDYFVDRFAGDFGHCTRKGNTLLANNIAQVIIKEYFNTLQ